jgi:ABC-2 type transport system permease protein
VRLYWEVAVRGYRRYATYRAATFAGVFTNTIFGFMRAYVLIALFKAQDDVAGWNLPDALTYAFVTQGLIMVTYMWSWWEIALAIRSGDVVTDLSRPLDYQGYWLAQDLGRATYHAIFRGIPPFIIGALFFTLSVPRNPVTWVAFVLSMALAVAVSFASRFILNLSAFWLLDYRGVGRLAMAVWTFMSGFAIPIVFFPEPLRMIARVLPFAAYIQAPVDVYLEKAQGWDMLGALGFQAMWALALLALGRWMLAAAMRKVVIQGG